jgi:hypothetical protein
LADYWQLEENTDRWQLEESTDCWLLEESGVVLDPPPPVIMASPQPAQWGGVAGWNKP